MTASRTTPPPPAFLLLREAIFRKVTTENGLKVADADHVVVTNGGMHGLYIIFRALLEPGDEVILPDPMWTEIAENIRLAGGKPVPVRLRLENGYQYDPTEIEAAVTPRTRAIFINTPQNPIGVVANRATLEAIAALAERRDLMIISDEAYEHVIFDGQKHVSLGSLPGRAGSHDQCLLAVQDVCHERAAPWLRGRHAAAASRANEEACPLHDQRCQLGGAIWRGRRPEWPAGFHPRHGPRIPEAARHPVLGRWKRRRTFRRSSRAGRSICGRASSPTGPDTTASGTIGR